VARRPQPALPDPQQSLAHSLLHSGTVGAHAQATSARTNAAGDAAAAPATAVQPGAAVPDHLVRRALLVVLLGAMVFAAVLLAADGPRALEALTAFDWRLLPLAVALTLWNYLVRWVKWHYFLRLVRVEVPVAESLTVFLGGMGMAITPGKVGELLKAYLLRQTRGTPVSVTAPIVVAERLTDGLAMVLLALGGIASVRGGAQAVAAFLIPAMALILLVRWRRGADRALCLAARLPVLSARAGQLRAFYESTYHLLGLRALAVTVALGVVSWFGECAALYIILAGLGLVPTAGLLLQSTFAMATSTLVGTFSMLPGGLGLAEASLFGLLMLFVPGISRQQSAAATMLFRLVTFWMGIALGLGTLAFLLHHIGRRTGARR
jgi:uncharacterized protein (TIRG00374 family)